MPAITNVLVLYWHDGPPSTLRASIRKHLAALEGAPTEYRLLYYNIDDGPPPSWMRFLPFDAVIFHTLALTVRWHAGFEKRRSKYEWITDLECVKIAIPQDEYDDCEVLDEWLGELGVDVIFSNFHEEQRRILYPTLHDKVEFHYCLTGYVDDDAAAGFAPMLRPIRERPLDIVYRAARLQYWFGRQGQLKHRVGEIISQQAGAADLSADISTCPQDAIRGLDWLDFLASGRVAIGCESGSSCLDRRGEIKRAVKAMLLVDPGLSFEEVSCRLPPGWDEYRFFAISPRHFEAAMTRTCQLLVQGAYSGVMEANVHYLPIAPDLSDVREVLESLGDHERLQRVADRAYEELVSSHLYSYSRFASMLEGVIKAHPRPRRRRLLPPIWLALTHWVTGSRSTRSMQVRGWQ